MDITPPKPPITITDIVVGRLYPTSVAAAIFSYSRMWAVLRCQDGTFPHAERLPNSNRWLIPGADLIALYGRDQLEADRTAVAAAIPTAGEVRRRAEAALKRLAKTGAKGKAVTA